MIYLTVAILITTFYIVEIYRSNKINSDRLISTFLTSIFPCPALGKRCANCRGPTRCDPQKADLDEPVDTCRCHRPSAARNRYGGRWPCEASHPDPHPRRQIPTVRTWEVEFNRQRAPNILRSLRFGSGRTSAAGEGEETAERREGRRLRDVLTRSTT